MRATGAAGAADSLGREGVGVPVLGEHAATSAPALAPMKSRRVRTDMLISADPGACLRRHRTRKIYLRRYAAWKVKRRSSQILLVTLTAQARRSSAFRPR